MQAVPSRTVRRDRGRVSGALGWWAISGEALMDMLRRVAAGEDPALVYAEEYANSDHDEHHGVGDGPTSPGGGGVAS